MSTERRPRLSLLCRVQQDREHAPCSGTADDGTDPLWPERPCECSCHPGSPDVGRDGLALDEGARWT